MRHIARIVAVILSALAVPRISQAQVLETFYEPVPSSYAEFGSAVAVVGDVLAVTSDFTGGHNGKVHLYDLQTGDHLLELSSPPADLSGFGEALVGIGGILAVGSHGTVDLFNVVPGSPNFGSFLRTLTPPQWDWQFGAALATAGDLLIVGGGSTGPVSAGGSLSDSIVYVYNPSTGALVRTLDAEVGGDDFGSSVAGSGNLVAVGAPQTTVSGVGGTGAAYVFRIDTGQLMLTLLSPDAITRGFGSAVAFTGSSVVVGATLPFYSNPAGAAYVFGASDGALVTTLHSPVPYNDDRFGTRMVSDDDTLAVTAGGNIDGTVYVFHSSSFSGPQIIQNPEPQTGISNGAFFGMSVALLGGDLLVGAPKNDFAPPIGSVQYRAGAVFLFDGLPPSPTPAPTASTSPTPTGTAMSTPTPRSSVTPSPSATSSPSSSPSPSGNPSPTPPPGDESIVASIEEPTCNGSSGISNIRGFAFTTRQGAEIQRLIEVVFDRGTDHESRTNIPCCSSRGDVAAGVPGAPQLSGFSGIFNWCLLSPGTHTITLVFKSSTGKTLTTTRQFISYCEHPNDPFITEAEYSWRFGTTCTAGDGGSAVFSPAADICDGEVRYEWNQATQGLALKSNCVPDGFHPPPASECSDAVLTE